MASHETDERSVSLEEAMSIVRQAIERNHFEDAANILQQIIEAKPDYADAVNYLAGVRYHQRRFPEAVELTQRAAQLAPDHAPIRNNLATMYVETGHFKEAVKTYQEAVHLDPTQVEPLLNLAWMLKTFDSVEEAEHLLKEALKLQPDSPEVHRRYSELLFSLGRNKEALDHGYEVLRLDRSGRVPVTLIMRATLRLEGPKAARKVLEKALEIDPDNAEAKHLLGSLNDQDMPDRAADDYVEQTFDSFAASFDEKLQSLHYRAPDLIGDRLDKLREGKPDKALDILDAGCGTGWSGQRLRRHTSSLVGIDLSKGMLSKAGQRGGYDELHQAELVTFIAGKTDSYDAIISADTLCYFGNLAPFCSAAQKALRSSGLLIFTLEEAASDCENGYLLSPSGRYQHQASYARSELEKAGLEILSEDRDILRQENLEDVNGLVYVARQTA